MLNRLFFLSTVLCLSCASTFAQDYVDEGKNRLNFAKTYFELGAQYSPSFTAGTLLENSIDQNAAAITPYLNVGGIHFWGHADFYISIPLSQFMLGEENFKDYRHDQSVVTGMRFLPWAYRDNKLRPYVGLSWTVSHFKYNLTEEDAQPLWSKNHLNADLGLIYGKGNSMFRLGMNFMPDNTWDYPIASGLVEQIETPKWGVNVGFVYSMETTKSKDSQEENNRLNQYEPLSAPTLNAKSVGDWFIGLGPSSSFLLSSSDYNQTYFPFLNDKPISKAFMDFGLGYHLNKKGLVFALAYRNIKFENNGFQVEQQIAKQSIVLEAYKYLTDYNGFTPYVGLNIGGSKIKYAETTASDLVNEQLYSYTPGFTFGWDILPGKTEHKFVLRTNLRWFPFEEFDQKGLSFSLNQLEYNVIQLVYYPSR